MKIDKDTIKYIANLAMIEILEDEEEKYSKDLEQILTYAEILDKMDMTKLPEFKNPINNSNKFRKDTEKKEAEELAKKLTGIMLKIKVRAGENGKIFGGVTSKEISEGLKKDYKIEIDKKKIILSETIKTLGNVTVDVKLYEGVMGKLKVDIIAE